MSTEDLKNKIKKERDRRIKDLSIELDKSNDKINSLLARIEEFKQKEEEWKEKKKVLLKERDAAITMHQNMIDSGFIVSKLDSEERKILESKEKIEKLHEIMLSDGLLTPQVPKLKGEADSNITSGLPWNERKKILNGLSFTKQIRQVPSLIAKTPSDVLKATNMILKLPGSSGVVIKDNSSKYLSSDDQIPKVSFKKNKLTAGSTSTGTPGISSTQGISVGEKKKKKEKDAKT